MMVMILPLFIKNINNRQYTNRIIRSQHNVLQGRKDKSIFGWSMFSKALLEKKGPTI